MASFRKRKMLPACEDAFVRVLEDLFRHGFREGPYAVEFAEELRLPVSEIERDPIRGDT